MTKDDRSARRTGAAGGFPQRAAFVLQFHADSAAEPGRFEGRIEHVGSGDRAVFRSPEDLLAFVRSVLTRPAPNAPRRPDEAAHPGAARSESAGGSPHTRTEGES